MQWVEKENWLYRTVFQVDSAQLARGAAELRFEGLDTYADVYLNGSLLLKSDNMFVGYTLPVKPVLRKGENRLMIRFRSAVNETLPQWESDGFNYPADNDHAEKRVSVYSRKAPYSYGWDWGIRLVTSGIWRPVKLVFYDDARIDDYYVRQQAISEQEARLENQLEVTNVTDKEQQAVVRIDYSCKGVEKTLEQTVSLAPGKTASACRWSSTSRICGCRTAGENRPCMTLPLP